MFCTALAFCVLSPSLPPAVGGSHVLQPPVAPGVETRADDHGRRAVATRFAPGAIDHSSSGTARTLAAANWEPIGPFGGDVADVAASPTTTGVVLAGIAPSGGSGGTMFRSTDGGASWTELSSFTGLSVHDLEFAPDGTAYAGTMDSVYKSTDDGANWVQKNLGIGVNDQTLEVTIDPNDPLRLWAGVADALGSQPNTLLLSTDGGNTWTPKVPVGGPYGFAAIAVDPSDSNKVYAAWQGAFGGGGVFVSSDGGTTWTNRSAGLPGNPMQDLVHDGTRLLLCGGQLFGSQNVGVWTTSDDGVTWTELSNAGWPLRVLHDLELEPGNPNHILAASVGNGIYESLDGGATWSFGVGGTGGLSSNEVSYDPLSAAMTLFVGSSSNAVWKSTDGGTSYGSSSLGIGQLNVYSIATNPLNPLEVAIAYQGLNDGGLQSSIDGGMTWSGESVPGTRWNVVRFDETGTLYALNDGPSSIAPEGVYRRSGGSWTGIGPDQGTLFETEMFAITFEPGDPNTIIAGGSDFGVTGHEATCWKTTDLGGTWTKTYEGIEPSENVTDIEYLVGGTDVLVASFNDFESVQDGGALRSANSGDSWAMSSTGLASECQGWNLDVADDGSVVYLADADYGTGLGGLYESTDGGLSWSLTNASGTTRHVTSLPSDSDTLFTTHSSAPKVRSSEDGGTSLGDYSTGLTTTAWMQGLHLDTPGSILYVATNAGSWRTSLGPDGTGTPYCFGDGTGDPCPCSNTGGTGEGCANSTGAGGLLSGHGSLSVLADDLGFDGAGLLPSQGALLFVANDQLTGLTFGDGLRCAGGALIRLGVKIPNASGDATWGPGLGVYGGWAAGDVRNFQLWYRDPGSSPCTFEFNTTNGVNVTFVP